ncbi:reverse transcriptase [Trichonephila clavipes]|nr:reverse transcriptase [Trichonephila clavipes]
MQRVSPFHLVTGHDFAGVYFYWFRLAADEACPLCGFARRDGDQLLHFTGLGDYPTADVISWYWEARRQMVNYPSKRVG